MRPMIAALLLAALGVSLLTCAVLDSEAEPKPTGPTADAAKAPPGVVLGHPEIDEGHDFTPCATCHKVASKAIHEDWHASTHGIANVKCYQCHGPFNEVRKVPEVSTCAVCHGAKARTMPADTVCWDCHLTHRFQGHRQDER